MLSERNSLYEALDYVLVVLGYFVHLWIGTCTHYSVLAVVRLRTVSCGDCAEPQANCKLSTPATADDGKYKAAGTAEIPLSRAGIEGFAESLEIQAWWGRKASSSWMLSLDEVQPQLDRG